VRGERLRLTDEAWRWSLRDVGCGEDWSEVEGRRMIDSYYMAV
jgi:hypothetical protein